jgi:hypothetical protein
MAENFCSAPLPHPLWEHYYAKALNQYYDSLERLSPYKDGGITRDRFQRDLPYLFKTDISFGFRQYALLNASREFCKYRLNSGFLLNSKVFSPD